MRLFVAVLPPEPVLQDLEDFMAPRWEAGRGLRWTQPYQWHVTLAFFPEAADRHLDDLGERLTRAAAKRHPFELSLGGGGAFPDPVGARVLWCGVHPTFPRHDPPWRPGHDAATELDRLAVGSRAAGAKAGAAVAAGRFSPHVTLARLPRPANVTAWLTVLSAYQGPLWPVTSMSLIESQLGQGSHRRPRYQLLGQYPVGARRD